LEHDPGGDGGRRTARRDRGPRAGSP
jgi:hypothetical protein